MKLGIRRPRKRERKKATDSAASELFKATALPTQRCQWICYNVTLRKAFCFRATHTGRRTGLFLFTHRDKGGLLWKTTHKRAGKACTYPQTKTNHLGTKKSIPKNTSVYQDRSPIGCVISSKTRLSSFKFRAWGSVTVGPVSLTPSLRAYGDFGLSTPPPRAQKGGTWIETYRFEVRESRQCFSCTDKGGGACFGNRQSNLEMIPINLKAPWQFRRP